MKAIVNHEMVRKQECTSHVKDIRDALYVLNGKWKLPLIFTINQGPRRFNEIQREVEGITPKVLAKELRDLELNGFIERKVLAVSPFTVTYLSTSYSETLHGVLGALSDWGEKHREKVREGMRAEHLKLKTAP